jgi:uncharacterized protein (UPF0332 family)
MSVEKLLRDGRVPPFNATHDEVNKAIEIAERDLALAEKILDDDLDWSFSIAYNAVLQTCRAYMFHRGYRPATTEGHKAVFDFMKATVAEPLKNTIYYFDRIRKKRHRTLYDEAGLITEKETKGLLRS